jgi:hypothetical protein
LQRCFAFKRLYLSKTKALFNKKHLFMSEIRCSRTYHRMKIYQRALFGAAVREAYYGHPLVFPSPPITQTDFDTLLKNYNTAYADYRNGGKGQKGLWITSQNKLLNALDLIADNVDTVADGNELIILQAGFEPIKTSRSSKNTPNIPTGVTATQGSRGVIITDCAAQGRDTNYGCLVTEQELVPGMIKALGAVLHIDAGITVPVYISQTGKRKKQFYGLKPLSTYYVYYYTFNTAGSSGLSKPVAVVCL